MIRHLCIVLHDVAPAYQRECDEMLAMIKTLGSPPLTLLVVPNFHERGLITHAHGLRRTIDKWVDRGAEVALHGLTHRDDLSRQSSISAWFPRHVLTSGEGEFSTLAAAEAAQRIAFGKDVLERCGWSPRGFVPPAWLASPGTEVALSKSSFSYTSTFTAFIELPSYRRISAPCLTVSTRSKYRRLVSRAVVEGLHIATRSSAIVRVGLHPSDARHPRVMLQWRRLIIRLMSERSAVTKSRVFELTGCPEMVRV